jgi:hypothetical protein
MLTAKAPTQGGPPVEEHQNVIIPSILAVVSRVTVIDIPGISARVAEVVPVGPLSSI